MLATEFFSTRADFESSCGGGVLADEGFEGSNLVPGDIGPCGGTLDRLAGCTPVWDPVKVVGGFQMQAAGLVGLHTALGVTSTVAGPDSFADNLVLDFTSGDDVFAVGFDAVFVPAIGPGTWELEVFGASGSLGSDNVSSGFFIGVKADEPITSIRLTNVSGFNGELIDNLTFGTCEAGGGGGGGGGSCDLTPVLDVLADITAALEDLKAEVTDIKAELTDVKAELTDVKAEITADAASACEIIELLHTPQGQRATDSCGGIDWPVKP